MPAPVMAIIVTTAATRDRAGITNIESSAQAADALRPIAGDFAFIVFSTGILGTGLIAVPVLARAAAYAIGEAFKWRSGSPGGRTMQRHSTQR
ncbi:Natural resistance-associated macrophage protein [Rhizobium tibeticum]|uniref:Mn2+ and Fe2+ transporters of the NRAMP family protein n=1 Tax=Rhizobium tibeticum TaxID=501024 RepID=A0A1H8L964_9HYPH|nr:Mn2+ and Fe2+ transporters of the NRAMP family protein [Rhizobium tibeticum]SEO01675.1 Natural resistance-associated macrophage protein [Rhizobium tibeticum]